MQHATEAQTLMQQLTMREARAPALRALRAPVDNGAELRLVVQQHEALLFELVKAVLRERLGGPTSRDWGDACAAASDQFDGSADPLVVRRMRVEIQTFKRCALWDQDEAAGRALPPVYDAVKFATIILEGSTT